MTPSHSNDKPSKLVQWVAWGALFAVILGIGVAYFKSEKPTAIQPLPVYGLVGSFVLTNQSGKTIRTDDLKGKVWVADIIFSRCPGPCAEMTRRMAGIQSALPVDPSVKLISLTTDPEFDTPPVLTEYGKRFGANMSRWEFLTGSKTELRRLAVEGLKLTTIEKEKESRSSPDDLFIHSTTFVVVDKEGRLRGVFESVGEDIDPVKSREKIVQAVQQLLKE